MTKKNDPTRLKNIGPASMKWLNTVGIFSFSDLKALGSVNAWWKVHEAGFNPSLNLLYALEGALRDQHWGELPPSVKSKLKEAITS